MNAKADKLRAALIMAGYTQTQSGSIKFKYFALHIDNINDVTNCIFIEKNKPKYVIVHPDLRKRISYNITHNTLAELLGIK